MAVCDELQTGLPTVASKKPAAVVSTKTVVSTPPCRAGRREAKRRAMAMAQIETYTITVAPSTHPGKVTAHSSDGHSLTTSTPLLDGARYWQALGAPSTAAIVITWSSGPGHWPLRSIIRYATSLTVMGDRFKRVE